MTNVAKKFAASSVGRSEKLHREAPDDPVHTTSENSTPCTEVKNGVDDAAEVGDLTLTIQEIPWDSIEKNSLAPTGRLKSQIVDCKRQRSFSPFETSFAFVVGTADNLQSCIMLEKCLINIRHTYFTADTSSRTNSKNKCMAPRVAKSLNASLAVTPKMSVAALLAVSPVSTAVCLQMRFRQTFRTRRALSHSRKH